MSLTIHYPGDNQSSKHLNALKPDVRWVDSQWGTWLIEIASGPGLRDMQGKLMNLAVLLDHEPTEVQALCTIASEKVTQERLQSELAQMRKVIRPDLANRLHVGRCDGSGENVLLEPSLPPLLKDVVTKAVRKAVTARRRSPGGTQLDVFAYLVRSWLAGNGPVMVKDIQEAVGASHPTVAAGLDQLKKQGVLHRLSDRSVELKGFPRDEWPRWLLATAQARKIARYVDPSRHARGPHEMAARLPKATKLRIAVSGVVGALQHFPDLDITSPPRLDLCIATEPGREDLAFVHKLDAGLVRDDDAPYPVLAVHMLPLRSDKQFTEVDGRLCADPLECLVAMYDMKLYEPAADMLEELIRRRPKPAG
jgi:hypothetical protein